MRNSSFLLALFAACQSMPTPAPPQAAVATLLAEQAAAWNAGDLPGYMSGYWNDPSLTFIGSRGPVHGWQPVLSGYQRAYPDAASRGRLEFETLEVRSLGSRHALVLGKFTLHRQTPSSGFFTLIVEQRPEGWRIVHDHSSEGS